LILFSIVTNSSSAGSENRLTQRTCRPGKTGRCAPLGVGVGGHFVERRTAAEMRLPGRRHERADGGGTAGFRRRAATADNRLVDKRISAATLEDLSKMADRTLSFRRKTVEIHL